MRRTPLLRPLREGGATLYVFPSATEDIGLNLNSRATGVSMSHYALLNLPDNLLGDDLTSNESLAESLLNYVFNFETVLLNLDSYSYLNYHTVSERVFWHWLKDKCGKMDLQPFSGNSTYYLEAGDQRNSRIVLCFGSIDSGNSLSTEFGMFNETYVNIPTSYGNGPVFFKTVLDPTETNYIKGKQYIPTNIDTLEGRNDEIINSLKILNDTDPLYENDGTTWYADSECLEIVKDIHEIQTILQTSMDDQDVIITSYDDINIDPHNYFNDHPTYDLSGKVEFNFNAILLYYSVYDLDDTGKASYATNLFGIIFLDSVKDGKITGLTKKMSYKGGTSVGTTGGYFGNSYSFRVNIKTLSVYDNTDAVIYDNTTTAGVDSVEFSDVIHNLNYAIDIMNTNILSMGVILSLYANILRFYDDYKETLDDVSTKLRSLTTGSSTSSMTLNTIRTNEILPTDRDKNMIKLSVRYKLNEADDRFEDPTDNTYVPPIIIANDSDTFNVPTQYTPVKIVGENTLGIWAETLSEEYLLSVIDDTNINYYNYGNLTYQNIELPETTLSNLKLSNIYKSPGDLFTLDEIEKNPLLLDVKYVNFNALIPLMIKYIQNLNAKVLSLQTTVDDLTKLIELEQQNPSVNDDTQAPESTDPNA